MHAEDSSDLIGPGVPGQQRGAQDAAHLLWEVPVMPHLDRINLMLQQFVQLRINDWKTALQHVGRKQQGELLGVKAQWDLEELAEGADVGRPAVREPGLGRLPVRAAELPENVAVDSDGAVADLVMRGLPRVRESPTRGRAVLPSMASVAWAPRT